MAEVVTGEAVVLDVPCAQFPARMAAAAVDLIVQGVALAGVVLALIFWAVSTNDAAAVLAVWTISYVLVVVGYSTVFETLSRGRTLGKMAMGLRVVSDDGGPIRFRQALVRGLTGAIEVWSVVGAPIGLITSILSPKGKRLGDVFAGTYVIQERVPQRRDLPLVFAAVPPPLAGWAQVADTARLDNLTAEAASSYLRRYQQLTVQARVDLGLQLAYAVAARVSPPPPPGTPPEAYLSAVLAVRRARDQAALAGRQAFMAETTAPGTQPAWPGGGPAWPGGGPAWPGAQPGWPGAAGAPGVAGVPQPAGMPWTAAAPPPAASPWAEPPAPAAEPAGLTEAAGPDQPGYGFAPPA